MAQYPRSTKQSEGPQGSLPGTGPDPNEINGSSDGVYAVQSGRFMDAADGYGEGQIHISTQEATSADQFPQAGSACIEQQMAGEEADDDIEL